MTAYVLWKLRTPCSIPGPEVIKLFSCSPSMEFFLLINIKMPTIVGILTFMSRKNSILGLYEPEKCCVSRYFYTYEYLNFMLNWLEHEKSFITSGPGPTAYFRFPFCWFRKGSCQLLAKVCAFSTGDRLGLSQPRISVVRLNDRPDMTTTVYRGRKTTHSVSLTIS